MTRRNRSRHYGTTPGLKPKVLTVPSDEMITYRHHTGNKLCGFDVTDLKLLKLHAEQAGNKRRYKLTDELRTICGNEAIVEMNHPPTFWCRFCYELDADMRRGHSHLPAIGDVLKPLREKP